MRPNVGRTARSQPNTSPMISAPPLAVSVIGTPADRHREQADQPADDDAEADEDHVGRDRRPVRVADLLRRPLDIGLGADQAQHVAAIDAGLEGERHRLPEPHELAQEDAARRLEGGELLRASCRPSPGS